MTGRRPESKVHVGGMKASKCCTTVLLTACLARAQVWTMRSCKQWYGLSTLPLALPERAKVTSTPTRDIILSHFAPLAIGGVGLQDMLAPEAVSFLDETEDVQRVDVVPQTAKVRHRFGWRSG